MSPITTHSTNTKSVEIIFNSGIPNDFDSTPIDCSQKKVYVNLKDPTQNEEWLQYLTKAACW